MTGEEALCSSDAIDLVKGEPTEEGKDLMPPGPPHLVPEKVTEQGSHCCDDENKRKLELADTCERTGSE